MQLESITDTDMTCGTVLKEIQRRKDWLRVCGAFWSVQKKLVLSLMVGAAFTAG